MYVFTPCMMSVGVVAFRYIAKRGTFFARDSGVNLGLVYALLPRGGNHHIIKCLKCYCSLTSSRYKKDPLIKRVILSFHHHPQIPITRMPPERPAKPALPQPYPRPISRPR